jgi:predicted phage terminase large subunit-like protein
MTRRRKAKAGAIPSLSSPRRRGSIFSEPRDSSASEHLDPRLREDDNGEGGDGNKEDAERKAPLDASLIEEVVWQGPDHIADFARELNGRLLDEAERNWLVWGRLPQQPPRDCDWRTWLIMAGRGFGKTRAGAEWVRMIAETDPAARIALVGATMSEARAVMVEGDSGLLAISHELRPRYEPSLGRLTWPGGAVAWLYSAAEPEHLRGPQHSHAWADEIAKWPDGIRLWDTLAMTIRLGRKPRTVATTTPRPVPLLRRLRANARGDVVVTRGRTHENAGHIAPDFLDAMDAHYAGTRFGRQELDGEWIDAIEGALWSRELIEDRRVAAIPAEVRRVVIGVDPPAGASAASDACGIVVVAKGEDGRAYVIADASVQGLSPEGWARAVAMAAEVHRADRVIAEANNGGAMVESVLRAAGARTLPVRLVHAAHGKAARAEPVAALYEAGTAFHVGAFQELEDEMAGLVIGGEYCGPGRSPDRADALVWAMTELMLGPGGREPRVRIIGG